MHCNSVVLTILSLFMGITTAIPASKVVVHSTVTIRSLSMVDGEVSTLSSPMSTQTSSSSQTGIVTTVAEVSILSNRKATKATLSNNVAPTHVAPSSCTTYYPTVMRQLLEAVPNVIEDNTADTTKAFHVSQSVSHSDNVKFNRIHQLVVFDNIAGGSWDCQLMVSWPDSKAGDMSVFSSSKHGSSATSSVSLDVYSASYNASAYAALTTPRGGKVGKPDSGPFATWNTMMDAIKLGNSLSVKGDNKNGQDKSVLAINARLSYFGTVGVNPSEYGVTVNSQACPPSDSKTLQFLFEVPTTDSRDASVSFSAAKEKNAGVYLIANLLNGDVGGVGVNERL